MFINNSVLRLIIYFIVENRFVFRELEVMLKLIDFVVYFEWNDFYVMVVMVFFNFLEDIESLEVILF